MDSVSHHGRSTAYHVSDRSAGGTPLLLVHGAGATHRVWKSQFRLADERPVIAVDLSGHGESEDIDASPGYETLSAYVDDVLAVTEETGASILAGCSLGGAALMTLALERDAPLDGLVLTATGARLAVLDDLLVWLDEEFDRALDFLHEPDRLFHDPDDRYASVSRETMRETGRAITYRDFLTCHRFDVRDRIESVDVPTLAVVGEHDRLTPTWFHEYLADEMPDCDLETIPDAAHLAMLERPEQFNDAVRSFLDRIETGTD